MLKHFEYNCCILMSISIFLFIVFIIQPRSHTLVSLKLLRNVVYFSPIITAYHQYSVHQKQLQQHGK